ncbi:MAG: UvrD-helicase domain-containing protein, partial [Holosporales bacterium]|nr:UvrD-helicase domain-containing protein [Holosporales bacterium]
MSNFESLNKEQKEAVQETEGAVLVLAGAGTGKTKVLTSRIAYIVSQKLCGIDQILAVTFTNKAAKEMKERSINLLTESAPFALDYSMMWIGTFHSLALRIIRPFYEKFKRTSNFSIIDSDDQIRIIKKIMKENEIDDKKYNPKSIAYYINRWKDQCKSVVEARNFVTKFTNEEIAHKIYSSYQPMLEYLDAIDFGDILMYCVDIFKYNSDILLRYQDKFKYIMVDEYQDTNIVQYMWLKLLSAKHGNICCVGDDDQSIYSWRGADVGNILKFEKDFKNAKVICLGQNYRSTKNILKVANTLISNNSLRMKKNFWTEGEIGLPVIIKSLDNPRAEASFISSLIENKYKNGTKFNEIAILVRATFQTRAFEERFIAIGIPYNISGGLKFYERKEIKDAVAYLRIIVNPDDGLAFERIINIPKRGIGITTINKFYTISKEENISIPAAAKKFSEHSSSVAGMKLVEFFNSISIWRENLQHYPPSELMQKVLDESGYLKMLKESKALEDEARLETLEELSSALTEFETVSEFLDYISLVLDNSAMADQDRVLISTIHAAKGLEYRTIFIPGFEEDILPHKKSIDEKGELGIEEERRLFYVAITRAKKEAYITMCNRRSTFGNYEIKQYVSPSRFLYDLPKSSV